MIGTQLRNEIIVFSYISDNFQPEFLVDLNDSKSSMIQVRESIFPPSPLPFFFGEFFLSLFFFFICWRLFSLVYRKHHLLKQQLRWVIWIIFRHWAGNTFTTFHLPFWNVNNLKFTGGLLWITEWNENQHCIIYIFFN